MKSFLRPMLGAVLLAAAGFIANPPGAPAQSAVSHLLRELNPLLSHAQGYLGVGVTDVDNDSVQKLQLKDNRGVLVTLIDHDAPAGSTLHINDVILEVNGQKIVNSEQFGRILKGIPAGRKVTLVLLREGAQQTLSVPLVDQKAMDDVVWRRIDSEDVAPPPSSGAGFFSGGGDAPSSLHMPLFTSSLNVGAIVEPLGLQMADYLGVSSGIMINKVTRKSEAAAAGLKAFDVILKVGADPVATTADWDRALRANEGKTVQVTILRERKQQVVTMQVDSRHHSKVTREDSARGERPVVA